MSAIPSTGNIGIDISIALVTGGAVTTWLTFLFDRISKRRQEYVEISKEKITKIDKIEPTCIRLASHLSKIAEILSKKKDDQDHILNFMFYAGTYVNLWYEIVSSYGYIQLHDVDSETVVQDLATSVFSDLRKNTKLETLSSLTNALKEYHTFSSFRDSILRQIADPFQTHPDINLFSQFSKYIDELNNDDFRRRELVQKALWYYQIFQREITNSYKIYYGEKNVKQYFKENDRILSQDLQYYLANKYPRYFQRLLRLKLA